jgi:AAA ATPase domain
MVGGTQGSPLRGRGDELAAIVARLDEVRSGVGSVIIVEGRAGLGKTRLLDACAAMAAERSFRVGRGVTEPHRRVVELDALFDALFDGDPPSSRATPSATIMRPRSRGSGSCRTSRL